MSMTMTESQVVSGLPSYRSQVILARQPRCAPNIDPMPQRHEAVWPSSAGLEMVDILASTFAKVCCKNP